MPREELNTLLHEHVLTNLVLCESRPKDPPETAKHPKYVYDALKQQPDEVCSQINQLNILFSFGTSCFLSPSPSSIPVGMLNKCQNSCVSYKVFEKAYALHVLGECFTDVLVERKGCLINLFVYRSRFQD